MIWALFVWRVLMTLVTAARDSGQNLRPNILRAIGAIVLTALFFAISDVYAQVLTRSLPPLEVTYLRWLVFVGFLLVWLRQKTLTAFVTRSLGWQILRGLLAVFSGITFIIGIKNMSISDATGVAFCGPVITMAMSVWFLGEHVGWRRWLVAAISLAGVIIIVQPGTSAFQWASLLPLMAAAFSSGTVMLIRHMKDEHPDTTLAYSALVGFVVLSFVVPFVWVWPATTDLFPILMSGCFGAMANLTMIAAYRGGAASRIAPFNYVQLPFAGLMGILVMNSFPSPLAILGMSLIAFSGVINAWLEARTRG